MSEHDSRQGAFYQVSDHEYGPNERRGEYDLKAETPVKVIESN